jgi:aryl-alcohol dehydrogenase-like predicted oxidoreductase
MEYRRLGNSGLEVSVVGLGCNNFGIRIDEAETTAVVGQALDSGINLFDTADVYGDAKSEEFLGKALGRRRHEAVIATKFASPMGEGPMRRGVSRRYILQAVEDSLGRLGTDYIDLYQVHSPDPATPLEETLRTLDDLVRSGKVRYIGNSNFAGWQIASAHWVAKSEHLEPFISAQNRYSLLNRTAETEVLPACAEYGLGILPHTPLGGGLLTGKYHTGEPPPEGTRFASARRGGRTLSERDMRVVEELRGFAELGGHSLVELAFSWLLSRPQVSSVIAGATKPQQVEENVAAASWELTAEDLDELDRLTK